MEPTWDSHVEIARFRKNNIKNRVLINMDFKIIIDYFIITQKPAFIVSQAHTSFCVVFPIIVDNF